MVEEEREVKSESEVCEELAGLQSLLSDPWVEGARWGLGFVLGEHDG